METRRLACLIIDFSAADEEAASPWIMAVPRAAAVSSRWWLAALVLLALPIRRLTWIPLDESRSMTGLL